MVQLHELELGDTFDDLLIEVRSLQAIQGEQGGSKSPMIRLRQLASSLLWPSLAAYEQYAEGVTR